MDANSVTRKGSIPNIWLMHIILCTYYMYIINVIQLLYFIITQYNNNTYDVHMY